MAMAYAALANGGTLFVPQIVERIEASDGRPIKTYDPKVARQVKISADALDTWQRGMWKVTNEKGGTAYDHGQFDLPVMGKTGTAEIRTRQKKEEDERDVEGYHPSRSHAWFAGWAPAEDPEIAIVVFVEHGGSGGRVAWPIAQKILDGYFTKIHPVPHAAPTPGAKPVKPAAARKERVR
jgi:penicillin-binding protein 2